MREPPQMQTTPGATLAGMRLEQPNATVRSPSSSVNSMNSPRTIFFSRALEMGTVPRGEGSDVTGGDGSGAACGESDACGESGSESLRRRRSPRGNRMRVTTQRPPACDVWVSGGVGLGLRAIDRAFPSPSRLVLRPRRRFHAVSVRRLSIRLRVEW